MENHILLVEPAYYSKFPPIGLLKISAFHKGQGDSTELVKFNKKTDSLPAKNPDKIYVTSLFTWTWRDVWDAVHFYRKKYPDVPVILGGIYASLLPDHAKLSGATSLFHGICQEVESLLPDYSIAPERDGKKWDGSIIFSSRGCHNRCKFCAVPTLEGKMNSERNSILPYIEPEYSRVIFFDNNFLANRYSGAIFDELVELDKKVDFNQGLDAKLITEQNAKRIADLKLDDSIRLAYDSIDRKKYVLKAIERLIDAGIKKRDIFVYALFNYIDTPEDFFSRVKDILNSGVVCYPMRYEPTFAIEKNYYISPNWTPHQVQMVQQARRVIGFGGAFPGYEGLVNKFNNAGTFDEAFALRESNGRK